jgi:putative N6-adenine-specific DNA methylase
VVSPPRRPRRSAKRSSARGARDCFAVAAPGLEPLVATELTALGLNRQLEVHEGGVAFSGTLQSVALANLWLRTASRVLVRVAQFRAVAFHELERLARAIPWEEFLAQGAPVRFRVTSHKSRLYHSGGIAQRLAEAVEHRLGRAPIAEGHSPDDETEESNAQLIVARVAHDRFTVSADSSGTLLHRRGYRQALAKAPVRETLAAALLLGSGWSGDTPLLDPMCGAGTIPIEGAMLARGMAPGANRDFAFLGWPATDREAWRLLREGALNRALPRAPVHIAGSDRDTGAIAAARGNAERAGVVDDVELAVRSLSDAETAVAGPGGGGSIVTNPPYGVRIGESRALRNLYAQLGKLTRLSFPGWTLALLSPDPQLDAQLGLSLEERFRTTNGGIPVRLMVASPVLVAR